MEYIDWEAHYESLLHGKFKHHCPEWDFMCIDETSPEWEFCSCYPEDVRKAANDSYPKRSSNHRPTRP